MEVTELTGEEGFKALFEELNRLTAENQSMKMLTKEQALVMTVMTGTGCMPAKDFREMIEAKLNRKVHAAEFNNEEFRMELRSLYEGEFFDMCYYPPHEGLILPPE